MITDKIKKGFRYLANSDYRFVINANKLGLHRNISDEEYLCHIFKEKMGYPLDLKNSRTFNEKLQWLKLYDRRPEYTMMVDKYRVKEYVAGIIGAEHIIPMLGVWDSFDAIDFDALPERFVLKCTHDSGGLVICKDKGSLDKIAAKEKIEKCLKYNYYWHSREWAYKDVPRKIIAEQYMEDTRVGELPDYKFFCFNGEVRCSYLASGRFSQEGLHATFFDRDWNMMPFERGQPSVKEGFPKPQNYEKMVELAEMLSKDIPFVRVDFYEVSGKIYFGELTFYPGAGMVAFTPVEWDYTLGSWIDLPKV